MIDMRMFHAAFLSLVPLVCSAAPKPADWVPVRWPWSDTQSLDLLNGTPVNCLLLTYATPEFVSAAAARGIVTLAVLMLAQPGQAAVCANAVYRAGCVGPNGAVGVRKPYPHRYGYRYHPQVSCAHGPYRTGCVGPHGAAVVRRPY